MSEPPGNPTPGDRCFVAVWPPDRLLEMLAGLERPSRPGLRWTRPEQWHVTLHFFSAVDPGRLSGALESATLPPAVARAGPRPRPLSGRVWMLPVGGLDGLERAVRSATGGLAEGEGNRPGRPFSGHLTLARARRPADLRGLATPDLRAEWHVGEVVAVRSRLGRDGATYEVLGRWPAGRGGGGTGYRR